MPIGKTIASVIVLAFVIGCVLIWQALEPNNISILRSGPLFPGIVFALALLPLYPLFRFAKRWPGLRIGIVMVLGCMSLTAFLAVAHYFYHIESPWIDGMFDATEILFFLSCVVLVWQGARQRSPK